MLYSEGKGNHFGALSQIEKAVLKSHSLLSSCLPLCSQAVTLYTKPKIMAPILDPSEHKHGDSDFEGMDIKPEMKHVAAVDSPHGSDPAGSKAGANQIQETSGHESARAHFGASAAVQGGSIKGDESSFAASSGVFTSGNDVSSMFDRAVRDSGGVRQGQAWVSDPAPGVHRSLVEHTITLENLKARSQFETNAHQGSGRTFESQRHAHWVK